MIKYLEKKIEFTSIVLLQNDINEVKQAIREGNNALNIKGMNKFCWTLSHSFENIYNETQKPTLNCDIDINESLQNINKDIQLRQSNTIKKNNFLNFK